MSSIPRSWPGFKVSYRFGTSRYKISVENPHHLNRGIGQVLLDGNLLPGSLIPLVDDGLAHDVQVVMECLAVTPPLPEVS